MSRRNAQILTEDSDGTDESSNDAVPSSFHGVSSMNPVHQAELTDQNFQDVVFEDRDFPMMAWDEDKPQDHGISGKDATMTLMAGIVGAGVMALSSLPKSGGIFLTTFLMVVSCFAALEAGSAFFKAAMAFNMYHKDDPTLRIATYEDFAFHAIGPAGPVVSQICVVVFFFGVSSGYYILMAGNFRSLFFTRWEASYETWVGILLFPLGFLCMLRDMSQVAKLMPIATGAAVASCLLIVIKSSEDISVWKDWPEEDIEQIHNDFPSGGILAIGGLVATLFGAFGCVPQCPPILDEMKEQKKFPNSLRTALGLVLLLYMGVCLMGYRGYGNFIQPNIVDSMVYHPANLDEALNCTNAMDWTGRKSHKSLPNLFSACVLVNMVLSYPLMMVTIFISIASASWTNGKVNPGSLNNYLMRVVMVLATFVVAWFVHDFSKLFALFASVCAPLLSAVFPLWFGSSIRAKVGARRSGGFRIVWHVLIYALSAFSIIFGLIGSVQNLMPSTA